jgi:hypothetical protein
MRTTVTVICRLINPLPLLCLVSCLTLALWITGRRNVLFIYSTVLAIAVSHDSHPLESRWSCSQARCHLP